MTRLPFATGFPGVDDAFGGMCPGEVAVFAGGPDSGKTAALVHVGAHLNVPVMAFADPEAAPRFRGRTSRFDLMVEGSGLRRFEEIERRALEARDVHGIGAVLIDDLQLLEGARCYGDDTPVRRNFWRFVRESGLAVLVSWGVELRSGGGARWSDLRGTIVEEPDLLMLVHDTEAEPPAIRFASFHPMPRDHRDTFVHDRLCFVE